MIADYHPSTNSQATFCTNFMLKRLWNLVDEHQSDRHLSMHQWKWSKELITAQCERPVSLYRSPTLKTPLCHPICIADVLK